MAFRVLLTVLAVVIFAVTASAAPPISMQKDYRKIQEFMRELKTQNPRLVEVFSLGRSGTGESIDGLRIGAGLVKTLIVATHHGNEYGSTEVALAAAAEFSRNPIADRTIYIIPVLNISGFDTARREENIRGNSGPTADPNRDYPGPCGSDGPFLLNSTKALADFVEREGIVTSATLHTFFPTVVYPWGFSTPDLGTSYDSLFIDLGRMATEISGYQVGNSAEVIYPADGTYEDYVFWKHGVWSLLFEVGHSHSPTEADLREMARVNVPGLRKLLENAPIQRATDHAFKGRCDTRLRRLDRREE